MKKIIMISAISVLLAACSNGPAGHISKSDTKNSVKTESISTSAATTQKAVLTPTEQKTTNEDASVQDKIPTTTTDVKKQTQTPEKVVTPQKNLDITSEGVFNGLADTNSVEIDANGISNVYIFDQKLNDKINQLPNESKVKFTYHTNGNNQNIITTIDTEK